jgi:hypothetical protein
MDLVLWELVGTLNYRTIGRLLVRSRIAMIKWGYNRTCSAMDSSTVAVVSTVSSAAVAISLAAIASYERYKQQKQQTMLHALEYLTGGSQKRSVGIAMIEGLWDKGHPYYRAIIPALTNQAVYLLLVTKSKGRHQIQNFLRIMDLILRVPANPDLHNHYIELIEALTKRQQEGATTSLGIPLAPETARKWKDNLGKHAGVK